MGAARKKSLTPVSNRVVKAGKRAKFGILEISRSLAGRQGREVHTGRQRILRKSIEV